MRKQLRTFILTFSIILLLSSCFSSNNENVDNAKKEFWIIKEDVKQEDELDINPPFEEDQQEEDQQEEDQQSYDLPTFEVIYDTSNRFIEIDDIFDSEIKLPKIEISWEVLAYVDKIEVSFSNEDSSYPKDNYTLTKFKPWDKTFVYYASSDFEVLDYGRNLYTISAYSWDEVSKVDLIINIPKILTPPENKEITYEKKLIWDGNDTLYMSFPESESFWKVIFTWTDTFTYSNIDNLEVKKVISEKVLCDWITEYLTEKLDSSFYWNTCGDIIKDKWISFYVVRLVGDNYFYEKYYIDNDNSLVGVYLIETWTWVTSENIKEKNDLLKQVNQDFKAVELVDDLFREIVR